MVVAGTRYVVPATSENSKYLLHQAQARPRNVRREWQRSEETCSANPCGKRRDWPSYLCESLRKVKYLKTEKSKRNETTSTGISSQKEHLQQASGTADPVPGTNKARLVHPLLALLTATWYSLCPIIVASSIIGTVIAKQLILARIM